MSVIIGLECFGDEECDIYDDITMTVMCNKSEKMLKCAV